MRFGATTRFDLTQIIKECQHRIKQALVEGFEYDHLVISKSDQFLRKHNNQKLEFAVVYVDLINSTRLSTELEPDFLSKLIMVYSQEVSYVVERFQGMVLKFVGDAVIGYFPYAENLDEVIQCGKAVVHVVRQAINPLLLQMGHDSIHVKVTADYGRHTIVRYGSDPKQSHIDLISVTMNLAAKMQSVAKADHMVIGKELYERLSNGQKTVFESASPDMLLHWTYHALESPTPYELYIASF